MKCVEKFKFERSESEKRDIDWEEAWKDWINEDMLKSSVKFISQE